jgi:hypothetical protein
MIGAQTEQSAMWRARRRVRGPARAEEHGRQGSLALQRVRRALVAQRQVRGGVPANLRQRPRSPSLDPPLPGLLQQPAPTFKP